MWLYDMDKYLRSKAVARQLMDFIQSDCKFMITLIIFMSFNGFMKENKYADLEFYRGGAQSLKTNLLHNLVGY